MDTLSVLNVVGVGQGGVLALALLTVRNPNRSANIILAALILTMSYVIAVLVLYHTRSIYDVPHLTGTQTPFVFVFGPLLYLYVKALCHGPASVRWRLDLLHFIPFVVYVGYLWPIYMLPASHKTEYVLGALFNDSSGFQRIQLKHMIATLIHGAVYLGFAMRIVLASRGFAWLRYLVGAFAGIWIVTGLRFVYDTFAEAPTSGTLLVIPSALALVVYAIGYVSLRHSVLFVRSADEEEPPTVKPEKYEKSTLTPDVAEHEKAELLRLMAKEKPYLNPDLSLQDLATLRNLSTHHLSEILNDYVECSFFDFVNSYRVNEAMRRLSDPRRDHFTITSIAHDVGFNSRSTFYTAFKKHAGCTPTAFKRRRDVE